jgi:RHS repeat-associated protein
MIGLPTGYTINVGSKSQAATMINNPNGSVKSLAITDGFYSNEDQTCQYLYDAYFRLSSNNCGSVWQSTYSYDAYGNISKSAGSGPGTSFLPTYSTSPNNNRYASIPGGTVTYDSNGNLTDDTFHAYTWDSDANPIAVDSTTFVFDAFDRRVEYGSGSSWTQFLYAPSDPSTTLAGASQQTSASLRIRLPGGAQALLGTSGVTDYRRPNWQGSEPIDSSTTQTVVNDSSFTPFGEHYQNNNGYNGFYAGNVSIWSSFMDGYTALNRLYHFDQGRWISPDPAGLSAVDPTNPQSWNRYAYVLNNPLSYTDPSGLFSPQDPPDPVPSSDQFGGSICYVISGWSYTNSPLSDIGPTLICKTVGTVLYAFSPGPSGGAGSGPSQYNPCSGASPTNLTYTQGTKSHIINTHLTLWRNMHPNLQKSQYMFEGGIKNTAQAWAMIQQFNAYSFAHPTSIQVSENGIAFTAPYPIHPPAAYVGIEQTQMPSLLFGLIRGPIGSLRTTMNTVVVGLDCSTVKTSFPGRPTAQQEP